MLQDSNLEVHNDQVSFSSGDASAYIQGNAGSVPVTSPVTQMLGHINSETQHQYDIFYATEVKFGTSELSGQNVYDASQKKYVEKAIPITFFGWGVTPGSPIMVELLLTNADADTVSKAINGTEQISSCALKFIAQAAYEVDGKMTYVKSVEAESTLTCGLNNTRDSYRLSPKKPNASHRLLALSLYPTKTQQKMTITPASTQNLVREFCSVGGASA